MMSLSFDLYAFIVKTVSVKGNLPSVADIDSDQLSMINLWNRDGVLLLSKLRLLITRQQIIQLSCLVG